MVTNNVPPDLKAREQKQDHGKNTHSRYKLQDAKGKQGQKETPHPPKCKQSSLKQSWYKQIGNKKNGRMKNLREKSSSE